MLLVVHSYRLLLLLQLVVGRWKKRQSSLGRRDHVVVMVMAMALMLMLMGVQQSLMTGTQPEEEDWLLLLLWMLSSSSLLLLIWTFLFWPL